MKTRTWIMLTTLAVIMVGTTAWAVPSAYTGPLGNPEEPALRPYKWLWRGVQALGFQTFNAFEQGNRDFPGLGSVYTFRGLRRGIVEYERSLWLGMIGCNPKTRPNACYEQVGKVNTMLDDNCVFGTLADSLTAAYAMGLATGSAPFRAEAGMMAVESVHVNGAACKAAGAIVAGQKILDTKCPVTKWGRCNEEEEEVVALASAPVRPCDKQSAPYGSVKHAQKRYIGERAALNTREGLVRENFLRDVRTNPRNLKNR